MTYLILGWLLNVAVALIGTFLVGQIWPKLGRLNARFLDGIAAPFRWAARTQRRHADSLDVAYDAYRMAWRESEFLKQPSCDLGPFLDDDEVRDAVNELRAGEAGGSGPRFGRRIAPKII